MAGVFVFNLCSFYTVGAVFIMRKVLYIFATWSREESGSGNRRQVNGPSIHLDHWGRLALATIIFMMNTAAWHLFCTLTMTMRE